MNLRSRWMQRVALWCLVLAGLAIRLPHIGDAPLEFHATRQYRSAVIARGYYIQDVPDYPAVYRQIAEAQAASMGPIEPPLFEKAAAALYRLAGHEALWMPRLLGVVIWVCGALALWWLVVPLWGASAGLIAAAVYLFLPYGIPASQAFQPDAAMTALIITALAALFWSGRTPSLGRDVIAALIAAAAVFVKPMAVFFILPAVAVLIISRRGWLRGLLHFTGWSLIVAAPAVAWYIHVAMTAPSVFEDRFFPALLARGVFWYDWLRMIDRVVTWPVALMAVVGTVMARGLERRALLAAWAGYLAFGLLFTHHIHTHDYYSLPIFPIVAWSIASLWSRVSLWSGASPSSRAQRQAVVVATLILLAGLVAAAWIHRPYPPDPQNAAEVARYERIGEIVHHSTNIAALDGSYGFPPNYHGMMIASNLPLSIDRAVFLMTGRDVTPESQLAALSGRDFFVGTLQRELDYQPDLRTLLESRFPVLWRDGTRLNWHCVVYDLRRTRMLFAPARISLTGRMGQPSQLGERVTIEAPQKVRWRVVATPPGVIDVTPDSGVGSGAISVTLRASSVVSDRVVYVDVIAEGQQMPSASLTVQTRR